MQTYKLLKYAYLMWCRCVLRFEDCWLITVFASNRIIVLIATSRLLKQHVKLQEVMYFTNMWWKYPR